MNISIGKLAFSANCLGITTSVVFLLLAGKAMAQTREVGVDVSHYQGSSGISQAWWNNLSLAGADFAFVKASEGLTGPDDAAVMANVQRASAAGVMVGVYHFAHPENRPTPAGAVLEADHLLSYAGAAIGPGYLRPVLDLEGSAAMLTTTALTDWVIAFSGEIIAQRGAAAAPIIYCSEAFANNELDSRLADYDLWLRAITSGDPTTGDPPNQGFTRPTGVFNNWAFWQFTDSASFGGISPLDADVAHTEFHPASYYLVPEPGFAALGTGFGIAWACSRRGRRSRRGNEADRRGA